MHYLNKMKRDRVAPTAFKYLELQVAKNASYVVASSKKVQ